LLEKYRKAFERSGAALDKEKQARLREINKELSTLTIEFSNHVLADNNAFKLVVDKQEDLAGLPEAVIAGAASEAEAQGEKGNGYLRCRSPAVHRCCSMHRTANCVNRFTRLTLLWATITMKTTTRRF
jgi:Zn-dependent oligopeptidase